MFFMKWIFLKLFGRGEPDRVRHLKCQTDIKSVPQGTKKTPPVGGTLRLGNGKEDKEGGAVVRGSLLPAKRSVLLNVLQRFKRRALRDESPPGKTNRDEQKLGDMRGRPFTNCASAKQLRQNKDVIHLFCFWTNRNAAK